MVRIPEEYSTNLSILQLHKNSFWLQELILKKLRNPNVEILVNVESGVYSMVNLHLQPQTIIRKFSCYNIYITWHILKNGISIE